MDAGLAQGHVALPKKERGRTFLSITIFYCISRASLSKGDRRSSLQRELVSGEEGERRGREEGERGGGERRGREEGERGGGERRGREEGERGGGERRGTYGNSTVVVIVAGHPNVSRHSPSSTP